MLRFKVVWENKEHEFIFAKSEDDARNWAEQQAGEKQSNVKAVTPCILDPKNQLKPSHVSTR